MIISGIRKTHLATASIHNACFSCRKQFTTEMDLHQRYFHVFWIPTFPITKKAQTTCSHCKQVLEQKEFTEELNGELTSLKAGTSTPFWTWSGSLLLAFFIGMVYWNGQQLAKKNQSFITTPKVGDIYEINQHFKDYTTYYVGRVTKDSIELFENKRSVPKIMEVSKLSNQYPSDFEMNPNVISRKALQKMLDEHLIMDVERVKRKS